MLSAFVDKSLLTRIGTDRFKLHELVRRFGEEKLSTDPDEYTFVLRSSLHDFGDRMDLYEKKDQSMEHIDEGMRVARQE